MIQYKSNDLFFRACLAQSVERKTFNLVAEGSSLSASILISLGGQDTRFSPERREFESRMRNGGLYRLYICNICNTYAVYARSEVRNHAAPPYSEMRKNYSPALLV